MKLTIVFKAREVLPLKLKWLSMQYDAKIILSNSSIIILSNKFFSPLY